MRFVLTNFPDELSISPTAHLESIYIIDLARQINKFLYIYFFFSTHLFEDLKVNYQFMKIFRGYP